MTRNVVQQIRRATRRQFTSEEKIRIVLEGLRGEISVLDDSSRRILAWRLQPAQDAAAFSEVVEDALEATGLDRAPEDGRPRRVTDRGAALISRDFGVYLEG